MRLPNKEYFLKEIPDFELSYDEIIHKKVYSNNIRILPKGLKSFLYFTNYNNINLCIVFILNKYNLVTDYFINKVSCDKKLCYGTVILGILCNYNKYRTFTCLDIIRYQGNTIEYDNKEKLGVSKIIVSGESGGGNLTLATTLKAKQDEKLFQIDGVYAQCPYISNEYHSSINNLPSLIENNGYFLNVNDMAVMATAYDGVDSKNPLAWPLFASNEDLIGLPPHVISVNELDPLRDEGLLYYKKLLISGVDASSITINGTVHAGDMIFINATPKIYRSSLMHINNFANSL